MKTPEETISRPVAPIVNSAEDWRAEMLRLAQKKTPSFFHLTAPLPSTGRTNQVLGATDMLSVVLKTYAEGGENELHAHPNEDHVFVVLQGGARFEGPAGEVHEARRYDCVLLPAGSLYKFKAFDDEALVLLRIGAAVSPGVDVLQRIGMDGRPFDGYSAENNEIPPTFMAGRYFA
ncbi:cupin domain-containing protein [Bacillus wiedmannii]|uniref:cupin domain-containing protein n=1 Tax=Bacillus wiedmannii TaxID=1890302 RepID=UPI0034644230